MFQPTCSFHCLSLSVTGTGRLTQSLFGSLVLAVLHVLSALCQVEKYRFRGMGKKSSRELSKGKVTERAEGRKIIISQSHVSRQQWQLWFDQTTCDNLTSCSSRLLQAVKIADCVETYLLGSADLPWEIKLVVPNLMMRRLGAAWILSCAGNSTVTQGVFSWYDS